MEFEILGWPPDGPTLSLDHERFAYAGKFVMSNTGKAVAREDGEIVAAIAFNADRTDDSILRLRYVTVADGARGEGIGARLAEFVKRRGLSRGFDRARIAVNNPFAFHALAKAGFGFTGEETGIAELVLEAPRPVDPEPYRRGLDRFLDRDLAATERSFVEEKMESGPPASRED